MTDSKFLHFTAIALFVAGLTYLLLRINAREKRSFAGDIVVGIGALNWVFVAMSVLLCGFMSTMLLKNNFQGPQNDAWAFWGVYIFSVFAMIWTTTSSVFSLLFPLTIRDDTIIYMTLKLKRQKKQISEIEHAYEDKNGTVRFEFEDGEKLAISRYLGGADAALKHIHNRLLEQIAEEFPVDQRTIN